MAGVMTAFEEGIDGALQGSGSGLGLRFFLDNLKILSDFDDDAYEFQWNNSILANIFSTTTNQDNFSLAMGSMEEGNPYFLFNRRVLLPSQTSAVVTYEAFGTSPGELEVRAHVDDIICRDLIQREDCMIWIYRGGGDCPNFSPYAVELEDYGFDPFLNFATTRDVFLTENNDLKEISTYCMGCLVLEENLSDAEESLLLREPEMKSAIQDTKISFDSLDGLVDSFSSNLSLLQKEY